MIDLDGSSSQFDHLQSQLILYRIQKKKTKMNVILAKNPKKFFKDPTKFWMYRGEDLGKIESISEVSLYQYYL